MADELGDRMKFYEGFESNRRLMPRLPAIARLDGKCFSNFTKGLERPFDPRLTELMIRTTEYLVKKTGALCGYTQSDEITLCWHAKDHDEQIFFDGRTQKMVSVLASEASVFFGKESIGLIPEKINETPLFDCRVWNVPDESEGANVFLCREIDATKNSIQMAARCLFSDKELFRKKSSEIQEMLFGRGVNWNNYPSNFKRGTYVQRRETKHCFTPEEIKNLPEKHLARTTPELLVYRSKIVRLDLPPLRKIKNRVDVIFNGAEPEKD